ncbi:MAG: RNA pseudouridine synthase [Flavobacteriales bacterium]|nr:MAG: RNA pseudouridine synthase [Flavobacteriales bacterium]
MKRSNIELSKRVLFEDNHLLVIDKLSGELAQGDITGDEDVLIKAKRYIAETYQKPGNVFIGLPHRLDRVTSGVLVLCRTGKALSRVSESFKNREPDKYYRCLVEGRLEPTRAMVEHFLQKNAKMNKSFCVGKESQDSKQARLQYEVLHYFDRYTFVEVKLLTGRHHQIRAQLSALGHPIKGDVKYGARRSNKDGGICLHSYRIELNHPVKKESINILSEIDFLSSWGFSL